MNNTTPPPSYYKVYTFIANSAIPTAQKELLESLLASLDEASISRLAIIFAHYPKAASMCANFMQEIQVQNKPVSAEKLQEILTRVITDSGFAQ